MNEMNDLERKKRLIVTALGAQQIYAQCHDECVDLKFFKHDLKMHSKNLITKLERELMPIFGMLGNVEGGGPYSNTIESMETTFQNLATLPVEYWAVINIAINDIKKRIYEKDQTSADGVSSGAVENGSSDQEDGGDANNNEEPSDAEEHEAAGDPTITESL